MKTIIQSVWKFLFYKENESNSLCKALIKYGYEAGSDDGLFWLLLRKNWTLSKIKVITQTKYLNHQLRNFFMRRRKYKTLPLPQKEEKKYILNLTNNDFIDSSISWVLVGILCLSFIYLCFYLFKSLYE